jgi:hypothetical protein
MMTIDYGDLPESSSDWSAEDIPPSQINPQRRRGFKALLALAWDDLHRFLWERSRRTVRTPGLRAFFDTMGEAERERLARLWAAVRAIDNDQPSEATLEAEALIREMPDSDDGEGAVAVRAFAEALLERIRKTTGNAGNLYLDGRPPGAQLRAFELLRLRTPLVSFAYAAANRALLEAVDEPADVTLLDIGTGRGGQVRALLKNPRARRVLRSLHVIGIEPDSQLTGGGALETAQANVLAAAAEARIPATFAGIGKRAEHLSVDDLTAARPRGLLLANSCLSLHHVGRVEHGAKRGRAEVLRTVRDAGFNHVVLTEPDTDHDEDELALRFLYAYRHYGTLARCLHTTLAASDAFLVWREFFTNEVCNVVAHEGALRVERHEESESWLERLEAGGWTIDTPLELVLPSAAPRGFEVVHTGKACTLRYEGVSLLAVMRAKFG